MEDNITSTNEKINANTNGDSNNNEVDERMKKQDRVFNQGDSKNDQPSGENPSAMPSPSPIEA